MGVTFRSLDPYANLEFETAAGENIWLLSDLNVARSEKEHTPGIVTRSF